MEKNLPRHDCEVCQGRGTVRHAIYRREPIAFWKSDASPVVSAAPALYRDYPCPECSIAAPESRVAFVEYHSRANADIRIADDPNYLRALSRNAGLRLADKLMQDGLITVERGPMDRHQLSFPITASIAVVSPAHREMMEQRITKGMEGYERDFLEAMRGYFGTFSVNNAMEAIRNKRKNTVRMELKQS